MQRPIPVQPVVLLGRTTRSQRPAAATDDAVAFRRRTPQPTSPLQRTVLHCRALDDGSLDVRAPIIVSAHAARSQVLAQLAELDDHGATALVSAGLTDFASRLSLAAVAALDGGDDPMLLVVSANHAFADRLHWRQAVRHATRLVADDAIVLLCNATRACSRRGAPASALNHTLSAHQRGRSRNSVDAALVARWRGGNTRPSSHGAFGLRASTWLAIRGHFASEGSGARTCGTAERGSHDALLGTALGGTTSGTTTAIAPRPSSDNIDDAFELRVLHVGESVIAEDARSAPDAAPLHDGQPIR